MTLEENYNTAVSLAVQMAKVTTREQVKVVTWAPFTLLYEAMIKRKEIEPISYQPKEVIMKYWNETDKEAKRYKRIFVMQALYTFDLITKE